MFDRYSSSSSSSSSKSTYAGLVEGFLKDISRQSREAASRKKKRDNSSEVFASRIMFGVDGNPLSSSDEYSYAKEKDAKEFFNFLRHFFEVRNRQYWIVDSKKRKRDGLSYVARDFPPDDDNLVLSRDEAHELFRMFILARSFKAESVKTHKPAMIKRIAKYLSSGQVLSVTSMLFYLMSPFIGRNLGVSSSVVTFLQNIVAPVIATAFGYSYAPMPHISALLAGYVAYFTVRQQDVPFDVFAEQYVEVPNELKGFLRPLLPGIASIAVVAGITFAKKITERVDEFLFGKNKSKKEKKKRDKKASALKTYLLTTLESHTSESSTIDEQSFVTGHSSLGLGNLFVAAYLDYLTEKDPKVADDKKPTGMNIVGNYRESRSLSKEMKKFVEIISNKFNSSSRRMSSKYYGDEKTARQIGNFSGYRVKVVEGKVALARPKSGLVNRISDKTVMEFFDFLPFYIQEIMKVKLLAIAETPNRLPPPDEILRRLSPDDTIDAFVNFLTLKNWLRHKNAINDIIQNKFKITFPSNLTELFNYSKRFISLGALFYYAFNTVAFQGAVSKVAADLGLGFLTSLPIVSAVVSSSWLPAALAASTVVLGDKVLGAWRQFSKAYSLQREYDDILANTDNVPSNWSSAVGSIWDNVTLFCVYALGLTLFPSAAILPMMGLSGNLNVFTNALTLVGLKTPLLYGLYFFTSRLRSLFRLLTTPSDSIVNDVKRYMYLNSTSTSGLHLGISMPNDVQENITGDRFISAVVKSFINYLSHTISASNGNTSVAKLNVSVAKAKREVIAELAYSMSLKNMFLLNVAALPWGKDLLYFLGFKPYTRSLDKELSSVTDKYRRFTKGGAKRTVPKPNKNPKSTGVLQGIIDMFAFGAEGVQSVISNVFGLSDWLRKTSFISIFATVLALGSYFLPPVDGLVAFAFGGFIPYATLLFFSGLIAKIVIPTEGDYAAASPAPSAPPLDARPDLNNNQLEVEPADDAEIEQRVENALNNTPGRPMGSRRP